MNAEVTKPELLFLKAVLKTKSIGKNTYGIPPNFASKVFPESNKVAGASRVGTIKKRLIERGIIEHIEAGNAWKPAVIKIPKYNFVEVEQYHNAGRPVKSFTGITDEVYLAYKKYRALVTKCYRSPNDEVLTKQLVAAGKKISQAVNENIVLHREKLNF